MKILSKDSCLNRCWGGQARQASGGEVIAENIQKNRWSAAITEVGARIQENLQIK